VSRAGPPSRPGMPGGWCRACRGTRRGTGRPVAEARDFFLTEEQLRDRFEDRVRDLRLLRHASRRRDAVAEPALVVGRGELRVLPRWVGPVAGRRGGSPRARWLAACPATTMPAALDSDAGPGPHRGSSPLSLSHGRAVRSPHAGAGVTAGVRSAPTTCTEPSVPGRRRAPLPRCWPLLPGPKHSLSPTRQATETYGAWAPPQRRAARQAIPSTEGAPVEPSQPEAVGARAGNDSLLAVASITGRTVRVTCHAPAPRLVPPHWVRSGGTVP
jgi:hypothetical protein